MRALITIVLVLVLWATITLLLESGAKRLRRRLRRPQVKGAERRWLGIAPWSIKVGLVIALVALIALTWLPTLV